MTCPGSIDWSCKSKAGHEGACDRGALKAGSGPIPTGAELETMTTCYFCGGRDAVMIHGSAAGVLYTCRPCRRRLALGEILTRSR